MSKFRTALKELIHALSTCPTCSIQVIHGHPTEFDTARALLARPEPAPCITREEAIRLLHTYRSVTAAISTSDPTDDERIVCVDAFEACLSAMLRP